MKRILISVIVILSVEGAISYWPKVQSWLAKSPQVAELVKNNPSVAALKQQVLNGGALRASDNAPDAYLTRQGTVAYTNQARQQNGNLPPLKENGLLDQDAEVKLKDMFARQYFEHVSPDGRGPSDQAKAIGYQYAIIGENLALGNFKNDQALVTAWMNSPGHRANILNSGYEDIGVAVGQGVFQGQRVWLAVQEFGKPVSSCPAIEGGLKVRIDGLKSDIDQIMPELQTLKSDIDSFPEPQNQQQVDAYNKLVTDYNNLVHIYNNKVDLLKRDTAQYNAEVEAFNTCAS